ncbi:hypothetical protein COP2_024623 [Malus domestica]
MRSLFRKKMMLLVRLQLHLWFGLWSSNLRRPWKFIRGARGACQAVQVQGLLLEDERQLPSVPRRVQQWRRDENHRRGRHGCLQGCSGCCAG